MAAEAVSPTFCWIFDHVKGNQAFHAGYRWLHFLSATTFVGLLAFLNLLLLSPSGEPAISRRLLQRVFTLWRWSALLFLFSGLNLLHMLYNFPTRNYFDGDKGLWMAVGASLGALVFGLAWFLVLPAQQRHWAAWPAPGHPARPLAARAALGLRIITAVMPTLLMGMAVGGHGLTLFTWGWADVAWTAGLSGGGILALYAWAARRQGSPA